MTFRLSAIVTCRASRAPAAGPARNECHRPPDAAAPRGAQRVCPQELLPCDPPQFIADSTRAELRTFHRSVKGHYQEAAQDRHIFQELRPLPRALNGILDV